MLRSAKLHDESLLREVLHAMGVSLSTEEVKRSLRQSKSLLGTDDWIWLESTLKSLHVGRFTRREAVEYTESA